MGRTGFWRRWGMWGLRRGVWWNCCRTGGCMREWPGRRGGRGWRDFRRRWLFRRMKDTTGKLWGRLVRITPGRPARGLAAGRGARPTSVNMGLHGDEELVWGGVHVARWRAAVSDLFTGSVGAGAYRERVADYVFHQSAA